MAITHKTDYLDDARGLQLEQYKLLPRFDALLQSYMLEVQAAEDALWIVFVARLLQNSPTGDLLARIGALVGQASYGLSDDLFLLLIQARIRANRSTGMRQDLIAITLLVASTTAAPIIVNDWPPASVTVEPYGPVALDPYIIVNDFLAGAVAAGVRLSFVWTMVLRSATLTFGSVYNPGFAVVANVCTNTGVTSSQSMGTVRNGSFAAGPPIVGDGGGVLAGVIAA